jgi:hypothetical protein
VSTISFRSTSLGALLTQLQSSELEQVRGQDGSYTFLFQNNSANTIYVERFDAVATSTTSIVLSSGNSLSISTKCIEKIYLLSGSGNSALIV